MTSGQVYCSSFSFPFILLPFYVYAIKNKITLHVTYICILYYIYHKHTNYRVHTKHVLHGRFEVFWRAILTIRDLAFTHRLQNVTPYKMRIYYTIVPEDIVFSYLSQAKNFLSLWKPKFNYSGHSGRAVWAMNCLRLLERWGHVFESRSSHECPYCVHLFCFCVVLCLGSGLVMGWSPVQGVQPTVYRIKKLKTWQRSKKGL
jgi:hypothetical protein